MSLFKSKEIGIAIIIVIILNYNTKIKKISRLKPKNQHNEIRNLKKKETIIINNITN